MTAKDKTQKLRKETYHAIPFRDSIAGGNTVTSYCEPTLWRFEGRPGTAEFHGGGNIRTRPRSAPLETALLVGAFCSGVCGLRVL